MSRSKARERKDSIKKASSLYRLDPFLDENGILCVGVESKEPMYQLS